jgi:hypothetical protein
MKRLIILGISFELEEAINNARENKITFESTSSNFYLVKKGRGIFLSYFIPLKEIALVIYTSKKREYFIIKEIPVTSSKLIEVINYYSSTNNKRKLIKYFKDNKFLALR